VWAESEGRTRRECNGEEREGRAKGESEKGGEKIGEELSEKREKGSGKKRAKKERIGKEGCVRAEERERGDCRVKGSEKRED